MKYYLVILVVIAVVLLFRHISTQEPYLNFHGHFKPKRHFFFERCSKCGKRLKHYHWFWGKGDFMACDVDYHGNTSWFCKTCNDELSKEVLHKIPQNGWWLTMPDRVKEKLVEIIQNSVGGCARHWAEVIADGLIAHGVTVQEWISVKDGLPESGEVVLGYMSFGEYRTLKWKNNTRRWEGQLLDYSMDFVTHWMPLPQPPKGE